MAKSNRASDPNAIFEAYRAGFEQYAQEEMPLREFLDACKSDRGMYASPHERLVRAFGEPVLVDTRKDERLGRIFENRTIRTYPKASKGFYGLWMVWEQIVSFCVRGMQGLDEKHKIPYLLGPAGGGKSSILERLKELMEQVPFYVLKYGNEISPVFESPLGLFSEQHQRRLFVDEYGVNEVHIPRVMSPWARKLLRQRLKGDISEFTVVRLFPSILDSIAIAVVDAGDEHNQDVSVLVGKTDIRKLEEFPQDDPDAYSFSGGLCRGNQGLVEFREMFKAPIRTLNPLLFATYDRAYQGTERVGAIPFDGIVFAHSNEAEWESFRANSANEAFIDRISLIKVPYVLQVDEVSQVLQKLVVESDLEAAMIAPHTLELLAGFSVLTAMKDPGESFTWLSKLRVYNGESMRDVDPKAKTMHEYRQTAGVTEGMTGLSPRFCFEVLAKTFNYDTEEIAANPVHLLYLLEETIRHAQMGEEKEALYVDEFLEILKEKLHGAVDRDIRAAFVESYEGFGQNLLDRYVMYADHWLEGKDYRDPDTGTNFDAEKLNAALEKIEKAAGIANPKDFRNEVVKYTLRHRADHQGENPNWRNYKKIKEVIEANMFEDDDVIIPVISFNGKKSKEDQQKHDDFVSRMVEQGYTKRQVRILVDWWEQTRKSR